MIILILHCMALYKALMGVYFLPSICPSVRNLKNSHLCRRVIGKKSENKKMRSAGQRNEVWVYLFFSLKCPMYDFFL